jgi:glycosyltransferase involved in cell wall biosynthesis
MKVLHVIDSGGLYGAEMMLLNLIQEQVNLGIEPTICSIGEPDVQEKPLETEALKKGFKVKKFRMRAGPNILGALKILKFAHEEHFSLIHTHGYKADILFGFIPKIVRKIPLVATLHGWTSIGRFTRMKIYEWLDMRSLKYFDSVVLVNKSMLSMPRLRKYHARNLSVINNGISAFDYDTDGQNRAIDSQFIDFCRDGFIVGAIGRLSPEKGFDQLIDAVYLLKKDTGLKLIIIGEGPLKEKLQTKINMMNLSDSAFLAGYLPSGRKYMKFFDVFVLSSLTEGLPITVLEAMFSKIPIVATKVGGIPEVLQNGEGGLLVERKKPEALADAILYIYKNPHFSKQIVNFSYNEVMTKYSSRTMALNYADVYRKVTKIHTDEIRGEL